MDLEKSDWTMRMCCVFRFLVFFNFFYQTDLKSKQQMNYQIYFSFALFLFFPVFNYLNEMAFDFIQTLKNFG